MYFFTRVVQDPVNSKIKLTLMVKSANFDPRTLHYVVGAMYFGFLTSIERVVVKIEQSLVGWLIPRLVEFNRIIQCL